MEWKVWWGDNFCATVQWPLKQHVINTGWASVDYIHSVDLGCLCSFCWVREQHVFLIESSRADLPLVHDEFKRWLIVNQSGKWERNSLEELSTILRLVEKDEIVAKYRNILPKPGVLKSRLIAWTWLTQCRVNSCAAYQVCTRLIHRNYPDRRLDSFVVTAVPLLGPSILFSPNLELS